MFLVQITTPGNATTKIINVNDNDLVSLNAFAARTNPFHADFSAKRVVLPSHVVVGDAVGSEARKKLASYIKDCIRALGLHKTPKDVSYRLEAYVEANEEYYGHVAHNDTVFIFYCNSTDGSDVDCTDESQRFTDDAAKALEMRYRRSVVLM